MKEFKIKIKNEAHSKAVQERLFALGYSWDGRGDVEISTNVPAGCFIVLFNHTTKELGWTRSPSSKQNLTLDDLYDMEKEPEAIKKKWFKVTVHNKGNERPHSYGTLFESEEDFLDSFGSANPKENFHWINLAAHHLTESGALCHEN